MHAKFFTSTIVLAAGFFAQSAIATIAYGQDGYNDVAWIYGANPCSNTAIVPEADNPCGHAFKLSNGYTYSLTGCGGPGLTLLNSDGSFNANCAYKPSNTGDCGVQQQWVC